jgi:hypothetical protein
MLPPPRAPALEPVIRIRYIRPAGGGHAAPRIVRCARQAGKDGGATTCAYGAPMRTSHLLLAALTSILAACAPAAPRTAAPPAPAAAAPSGFAGALAAISPASLHAHLDFLASDELRGRDTPSPGLERAAEYIADQFAAAGLSPKAGDGTFLQRWPLRGRGIDASTATFRLETGSARTALAYGADYFAIADGRTGIHGAIAYVGEANTADRPLRIAAGTIPVFHLPGRVLDPEWEIRASHAISRAAAAAAPAVVLVLDPAVSTDVVRDLADRFEGARMRLPVFGVRYDAMARLLAATGHQLDELRRSGLATVIPDARLHLASPSRAADAMPPNVVAVLPGSDPLLRETYLVLSAHFDHLGVGAPDASGDSIYNGADDNGSGTAALLAWARAFALLPEPPRRSILFLAVSGEERGLLGSQHFVANPPVPLDAMVANVNMDMLGRNHPDSLAAIGVDYTSLGPLATALARERTELSLTLTPDPWPRERLFFRSDHFSFAHRGVPALFFTTGLHADYHRPSDRIDTIDLDKLARITRLIFHLGYIVTSDPVAPQWTELGRREVGSLGGWSR